MIESWSDEHVAAFERDGFLIVDEGFISESAVGLLRGRFEPLFAGEYATGIRPDEVNWVPGRDPEDRTRQICNGWKADPAIAAQVLAEKTGRLAAELMGWDGVRLLQDNCIWDEVARDAPGRELPRLPRPAGDDHLLDRARRHLRRGRHDHVRGRVASLASRR
jgi:hypothetical protein